MSIVNELGFVIPSLEDRLFVTCSTGSQGIAGAGSTTNVVQSSAAAAGATTGRIIDRLGDQLTQRFTVAMPFTLLQSTRGSTEADRLHTVGVKLQHGDSSGGGDMADYSTGSQPDTRNFFTTARSSDMASWDSAGSTGAFRGMSNPAYYDLRAAKRYIRVAHIASKNRVTTESSGDEGSRLSGGILFIGAERLPQGTDVGFSSTSTTT